MEKILDLEKNRNRFLCSSCQTMFETRKYRAKEYKCRGCHPDFENSDERYYIDLLKELGFDAIMQQYSDKRALGVSGGRLRYDIAVFNKKTDLEPIFILEKLSQNDFNKNNQDGQRENYVKKVEFARDILQIPLIECGTYIPNPRMMLNEALSKYSELKKINNSKEYYDTLCKVFFDPIIIRIGNVYFEPYTNEIR